MIVAGIDVGKSGAIFLINPDIHRGEYHLMPLLSLEVNKKQKEEINVHGLATIFRSIYINHAFIEQAIPIKDQGAPATFNNGQAYMAVKMVCACLDIPFTIVHPAVWKKALDVPSSKDGSILRASQLMPYNVHLWPKGPKGGKPNHNVAEAALIAYYGVQIMKGEKRVRIAL